jgi:hypothetical protein
MNLHIAATDRTPEVLLTENPLHFKLMGESFPEDVSVFYGPVITSINNLSLAPQGPLRVEMELTYINSSSIKAMYRIFEGIESYRKTGSVVNVVWKSDKDDDIRTIAMTGRADGLGPSPLVSQVSATKRRLC